MDDLANARNPSERGLAAHPDGDPLCLPGSGTNRFLAHFDQRQCLVGHGAGAGPHGILGPNRP